MMSEGRILYVEDDPDVANVIRLFFESEGYEIFIAPSGEEAIEHCRHELPNVILLDIMLPEMDGYDVFRSLRESLRTSHIPVLFLTALDGQSKKIEGLELGADDYITKPFDIDELGLRVRNAIRRTQREQLTNSITGLPSGELIEEQLRTLTYRQDWALLYTGINHIIEFGEMYGFVAGDDVLRFTAMTLNDGVEKCGTIDDFVGHIRADEFIVITDTEHVEGIQSYIIERFEDEIGTFYPFRDRDRGHMVLQDGSGERRCIPLMTVAIGVVTSQTVQSEQVNEIAKVAAEARRMAMLSDAPDE